MYTKKTFALAVVLAFAVPSFAQPATTKQSTDPNYDPKAKAILDDVSKTAKAYTSITATFTITLTHPDKTSEVKNGSVMMKNSCYKITLDDKGKTKAGKDTIFKEEYYNDTKTTWTYSGKDNEVTIDNAPDPAKVQKSNSISPNDIFTIHEKGFKYKFIKEEMQNGRMMQLIDLYPDNPDKKNYHTVKLTIDKEKKQITSVVFMNKDGSTTTYTIKTFTPNTDVPDSTFQFDQKAHPKVSVVDLRDDDK